MKSCADSRSQIELRLDGMLNAAGQTRLNAHLSQCSTCREYDAAQRVLSGDLVLLSRVADMRAVSSVPKTRRAPQWMHAGKVAAALAFAVLCTWTFVRRPSPQPRPYAGPTVVQPPAHEEDGAPPTRFTVSIAPADGDSRFTIPIETENPRIHMVWMYDAVSPDVDFAPSSAPSSS